MHQTGLLIPVAETDLLHEEIHQRDLELDQLRQEIETLKAEKEEIKNENQVEMNNLKQKLSHEARCAEIAHKTELENAMKTYKVCVEQSKHSLQAKVAKLEAEIEEIKEKCQNNAYEIDDLRFKLQNAENSANNLCQERNDAQNNVGNLISRVDAMDDNWRAQNVNIFKSILERFGCKAAWDIAQKFVFFNLINGDLKHNGDVRYQNYGNRRCVRVYYFNQEMCFSCFHRRGRCKHLNQTPIQPF